MCFSTIVQCYVRYERFVKLADVHYLGHGVVIVVGIALPKLNWVVQGVISSFLFFCGTPGNSARFIIKSSIEA